MKIMRWLCWLDRHDWGETAYVQTEANPDIFIGTMICGRCGVKTLHKADFSATTYGPSE